MGWKTEVKKEYSTMKNVRKAVTTALGALITVVGVIVTGNPDWARPEWLTQELVGAAGAAITTGLTWLIPNDEQDEGDETAA